MRALTISELERLSGVPRGVIYYYIRRGLLPPAQKTSATRAIYSDEHVEYLRQIAELKEGGLALANIRDRLSVRIKASRANEVDLAASQAQQRREAILQEAARQFAEKGYNGTRIGDIVHALGMAHPQLYSFFPTKHHLFVACYNVFFRWMSVQTEPRAAEESDPAARLAWRLRAALSIHSLSPELQAFAQAESLMAQDGDLPRLIRETFQTLLARDIEDLGSLRREGMTVPSLSDELLSFGVFGAFEGILMRVSWDDKYTKWEAVRNLLAIFLAIEAVYEGRVDISERLAQLQGLIDHLSRLPTPRPLAGSE
jgi:AcrR family transcriptional regulator